MKFSRCPAMLVTAIALGLTVAYGGTRTHSRFSCSTNSAQILPLKGSPATAPASLPSFSWPYGAKGPLSSEPVNPPEALRQALAIARSFRGDERIALTATDHELIVAAGQFTPVELTGSNNLTLSNHPPVVLDVIESKDAVYLIDLRNVLDQRNALPVLVSVYRFSKGDQDHAAALTSKAIFTTTPASGVPLVSSHASYKQVRLLGHSATYGVKVDGKSYLLIVTLDRPSARLVEDRR